MITNLGIIWIVIELLIGNQMIYYVIFNTGNHYIATTILYWVWLGIYVWNPFNIFYINNKEN